MEKLKEEIKLTGLGKPTTATLIKRTKKKAMYFRDDGCYEVFKIKISKANTIFGKDYPEREIYPNSEDFGQCAWCYNYKDLAEEKYRNL